MQVDVQQIYVRDQRIRRAHQGLGVAAMVMIVLGVILSLPPNPKLESTVLEAPTLAILEAKADRLVAKVDFLLEMDAEVQTHLDRVATITLLERKIRHIKDPLDQVKVEVDKAVQAMVVSADCFWQTPGLRRQAIKEYEKVVTLFPENRWARVAKKRILTLHH
jgi:predicted type IV restriction endonuclease